MAKYSVMLNKRLKKTLLQICDEYPVSRRADRGLAVIAPTCRIDFVVKEPLVELQYTTRPDGQVLYKTVADFHAWDLEAATPITPKPFTVTAQNIADIYNTMLKKLQTQHAEKQKAIVK